MAIRPYRVGDDDALYDVCLRTGDLGEDASSTYTEPRLLGEIYVGPYLRLEPNLAFVTVDDIDVKAGSRGDSGGEPTGYIVGAADTRAFEAACDRLWWPALRERFPRGCFPHGSGDARLVELIHRPERASDEIVAAYPSHLHIDLLPRTQGHGAGRALMDRLLGAFRAAGSPGVHLGVAAQNERAIGFYQRMGFVVLKRRPEAFIMGRQT